MARAINHDTGSSVATGTWEAAKGAAIGLAALPVIGALLLGGGAAILGFGLGSVIALGIGGAAVGAIGSVLGAGPIAAIGGLLGLGRGANKISEEKAAYQSKVMANERQALRETSMVQAQLGQQDYKVGFQEGEAFAVQNIQRELQQQAMAQQAQQQNTLMGQTPVEGHHAHKVLAARGGHQHTSKTDMIAQQKEQAAGVSQEI